MTLREVRGNVASREFTLGIFAFLELAEALRGRSKEGLCVASHVRRWATGHPSWTATLDGENEVLKERVANGLALNATGSQFSIVSIAPVREGKR